MMYFVRHGESEANRDGRFAGITTSPLTQTGELQATNIGHRLNRMGIKPQRIITSALVRARQTALIIADQLGYDSEKILIDECFNEYDFGELNGQLKEGIDSRRFVQAINREDPQAFYERISRGWNKYYHLEGDSLIVSHSFVRLGVECAIEGGDILHFHERAPMNESHSYVMTYDARPI